MATRDEQTGLMKLGAFTFVVDHVVRRASRSGECATLLSIRLAPPEGGKRGAPPEGGKWGAAPAGGKRAPLPGENVPVYRVARLLRTELRGEDVIARVGDREFAVALPDTDAEGGETVIGFLAAELVEEGILDPDAAVPAVVIGRATFAPTDGPVSAGELLEAARASLAGPTTVVGKGRQARDLVGAADRGDRAAAPAGGTTRRHLRSLRSHDD